LIKYNVNIKRYVNILTIANTMSGPYFITTLEADVRVHPNQMNNNIADNIRRNLERDYLNKCYNNYGYIDKLYDVSNDIKGGIIRAEDNTSSSVHRVKFNCRICNPMKRSIIMGRIVSINNMMIVAENGPIKFIIGESDINMKNIQFKKSAFYPVSSKGELINNPIVKGTYVTIMVMNKKLVKGKRNILVFGRLESVILDDNEKVKDAIRDQYESSEHISAYDLENDKLPTLNTDSDNPENYSAETDNSENDE
jgi:DNA-directed RNA polymerase subunit E'/Rpb7